MRVKNFSTLAGMEMKDWIHAARLHAKLTQQQLGDAMGVTKGNVSSWEKGRHDASHEQLVKIAAITGYKEPLPGMVEPLVTSTPLWPFPTIDEAKVRALDDTKRNQLEAAIIISAAQLGLDVKKDA